MTKRQIVLEEAQTWMGTLWMANACIKGVGVDCGRFLYACFKVAGVELPDLNTIGHWPGDWALHRMADAEPLLKIIQTCTIEFAADPLPADVVMFKMGRAYSHTAIVMEWPSVIHVLGNGRVEIADAHKAPLEGRQPRFFSPWKKDELQ